jgi:hypothetical protein
MHSEFSNFEKLSRKVMAVSKTEILRREDEYKKISQANPKRRGPKRKPKMVSASLAPDAS